MRTHYEVLGVAPTVGQDGLHRAYRAAVRRTHPDAGGDPADFREVRRAWQALSDPERRSRYDLWLLGRTTTGDAAEEQPWQGPRTGMPSVRLTAVGPVAMSGLMLVLVLSMLGPAYAVAGGALVLLTVLALLHRARADLDPAAQERARRSVRALVTAAWVAAAGWVGLVAVDLIVERPPTMPLLLTLCTMVFACAAEVAAYLQTAARRSRGEP